MPTPTRGAKIKLPEDVWITEDASQNNEKVIVRRFAQIEETRKKIQDWSKLEHPNVVSYRNSKVVGGNVQITEEIYAIDTSLQDIIESPALLSILTFQNIKIIMHQILKGLSHMHSLEVTHGNLKPHVIFKSQDKKRVQISFHESEVTDEEFEIRQQKDMTAAAKIFLFLLSRGQYDFEIDPIDFMANELKIKVSAQRLEEMELARDIILRMLQKGSAVEALTHPFFWTFTAKLEYLQQIACKAEKYSESQFLTENSNAAPSIADDDWIKFAIISDTNVNSELKRFESQPYLYCLRLIEICLRGLQGESERVFLQAAKFLWAKILSYCPNLFSHVYRKMTESDHEEETADFFRSSNCIETKYIREGISKATTQGIGENSISFPEGAFAGETDVDVVVETDRAKWPHGHIAITAMLSIVPGNPLFQNALLRMRPWLYRNKQNEKHANVIAFRRELTTNEWKEIETIPMKSEGFYEISLRDCSPVVIAVPEGDLEADICRLKGYMLASRTRNITTVFTLDDGIAQLRLPMNLTLRLVSTILATHLGDVIESRVSSPGFVDNDASRQTFTIDPAFLQAPEKIHDWVLQPEINNNHNTALLQWHVVQNGQEIEQPHWYNYIFDNEGGNGDNANGPRLAGLPSINIVATFVAINGGVINIGPGAIDNMNVGLVNGRVINIGSETIVNITAGIVATEGAVVNIESENIAYQTVPGNEPIE